MMIELWTIYERPDPLGYMAVRSPVGERMHLVMSSYLETLRAELTARGLTRIAKDPGDDPAIVELYYND